MSQSTMSRPATAPASPAAAERKRLLARLHMAKAERGLDDDAYRDLLERETGRRSAKDVTEAQIARVLDLLTGTGVAAAGRGFGVVAAGPYAPKIKALWLSGWHLGVVRNRTDAALLAFVKRQTGLDHTRFLREGRDAARAIEALKAWLARDAGVAWGEQHDRAAIVAAQWRRLAERGAAGRRFAADDEADALARYAQAVTGKAALQFMSDEDWDQLIRALGAKLRKCLAGGTATTTSKGETT